MVDGLEDGEIILVDKELVLMDEVVVAAVDDGGDADGHVLPPDRR